VQNIHNLEGVCPYCGHSNFMLRIDHWIEPKVLSTNYQLRVPQSAVSNIQFGVEMQKSYKVKVGSLNLKCTKYIFELHTSMLAIFKSTLFKFNIVPQSQFPNWLNTLVSLEI
jgi:hypothetical protein